MPPEQTRMVYAVNRAAESTLTTIGRTKRVGELALKISLGWDESADRKKGFFETDWGSPHFWDDVILQGPHLFVGTPIYKSPNETMLHHRDWTETDFEALAPNTVPVTSYKPIGDRHRYDCAYTDWGDANHPDPARDHYRVAWRAMAANTGERTLVPALIPPGAAHVHPVFSAGQPVGGLRSLVAVTGFLSSLMCDFAVRVAPRSAISGATVNRLPYVDGPLTPALVLRTLRLNCTTEAYADLWSAAYEAEFAEARWALEPVTDTPLAAGPTWTEDTPLRIAADRRRALVENDALVALMLGLSADELCTIYRTQFAVLYGYDTKRDHYDANGRLVPNSVLTVWRMKGDRISLEERTATNQAGNTYVYELPFVTFDRETDMRQAYEHFERRLARLG